MADLLIYDAWDAPRAALIAAFLQRRQRSALVRYRWYPSAYDRCSWQAFAHGVPVGTHATEVDARFAVLLAAPSPGARRYWHAQRAAQATRTLAP